MRKIMWAVALSILLSYSPPSEVQAAGTPQLIPAQYWSAVSCYFGDLYYTCVVSGLPAVCGGFPSCPYSNCTDILMVMVDGGIPIHMIVDGMLGCAWSG